MKRMCSFVVALVVVVAGCSDDGDDAGDPQRDPEDVIDAALLSEEDVDGLEAETETTWSDPLDGCDSAGDVAAPDATRTVSFGGPTRTGTRLQVVFQSVAAFPDEDAAVSYADTLGEAFPDCVRQADPSAGGLVVADVETLAVAGADLGDHAGGWSLTYEPNQQIDPSLIRGMELVVVQRGPVVATVSGFVPFPDLDVVELAEKTYERLPG